MDTYLDRLVTLLVGIKGYWNQCFVIIFAITYKTKKTCYCIFKLKLFNNVTSALEGLNLETLAARRGKTRHSLLLKLLTNEENHNSLINAYEDLMDTKPTNMPNTRAAARGDPRTIYAKTLAYHNSFLPRTIRELKANLNTVSINQ